MNTKSKNVLILHNIRSVLNVGAIFRTSDAIGIDKIYLSGFSPSPIDRFGRERNDFQKASLGAHKFVDWEYFERIEDIFEKLKKENFKFFAIEQDQKSIDYKKASLGEKNAFIFGNENLGVDEFSLKNSDEILELKMRGEKESLNVSTTVGIVLFRLLDK